MITDKGKTDFMQGLGSESEEARAYREMLDYLVRAGHYTDAAQADNDASERVQFCEEMDLYADDARLKNASVLQRKLQALIHSNQLQEVLADNGGYLPGSGATGSTLTSLAEQDDEVLPEIYPDPDFSDTPDHFDTNEIGTDPDTEQDTDTERFAANDDLARSADDDATVALIMETVSAKENSFLHLIRYLSTALGIIAVLLAASRFYFDSDALLRISKYSFLLFTMLLLVAVALSEVSGRLMRRLRYAVSYLFLLTTATLSGLLFLQQPWAETTLQLHGGMVAMIFNFLIHRVIVIGPFWLGVFFASIALLLLIITWFAGRKISDD